MFNEKKTCPVCGSTYVELYNSHKTTYHCHSCDSYWRDRTGIVIENNYLKYLDQPKTKGQQPSVSQQIPHYRHLERLHGS